MHLYNAWLPPPVAEAAKREKDVFAGVVRSVKELYDSGDPESVYSTLKWVPIVELFLKARSDVNIEDVSTIVEVGLKVFLTADNKLYAQVKWGNMLVKWLNKYRKKLSLEVQWRPLYDTLINTHFTRNTGPEGFRLRQQHFHMVISLVQACRRFFPEGSAFEIWSEFRSFMENPWHNASFEGVGILRLFFPTNLANRDFFQNDWIRICLDHWTSIPNCQFWNTQWASLIARVIKNCNFLDWDFVLPDLFNIYLNMFGVPVANGRASHPFPRDIPRSLEILFANRTASLSKSIAKSIVYLIKPSSSAQKHFAKLVNLLEQYYHPSNGGRWTHSLGQFLYHLVKIFQKRLQLEQLDSGQVEAADIFMANHERASFVNSVLTLIHRGQYSKDDQLSRAVAHAISLLSYIEPSLVLPFLANSFCMALETTTATHQLKNSLTSVAFAGRSLLFATLPRGHSNVDGAGSYADILMISLSNALLGMDANDPPKTIATIQLIGSLFSSIYSLDDNLNVGSLISSLPLSEWVDEFLDRLFSLLQHLEHSDVMNDGLHSSIGTFLVEDGPYYFCMLGILFGRVSDSLYKQALRKISKFVTTNILPGATAEVGFLCCASVHSNPGEAVVQVIKPIIELLISSLKATPTTGFGGRGAFNASLPRKKKSSLSPNLEASIVYQLKVLACGISYGGPALLHYKDQLTEVIGLAFDSASWKVNRAGDHVLRSLLGSLVHYYPVDQYKCIARHPLSPLIEEWIDKKDFSVDNKPIVGPEWHIPKVEEVNFANDLLRLHLESALHDLLCIFQSKIHSDSEDEKDHLKVALLRVDSSLQGILSCLPDFKLRSTDGISENGDGFPFLIAGAIGSCVGSSELREKAADVIHEACKYLLKEKSDDSILFMLLIRIIDTLANYGSAEYDEWSNQQQAWKLESAATIEPTVNLIVSSHSKGKRRPRWALIDKVHMHNNWRSSQSSYHLFRMGRDKFPSDHVSLLVDDLLDLSLHNYETVRRLAGKCILNLIRRWPSITGKCVLKLAENLRNPVSPEHAVLGSCAILSSQTILKRLSMDMKVLSSFLLGILYSSHNESLKAQNAITELFVTFNTHFVGLPRKILGEDHAYGTEFSNLVAEISSMSFLSTNLHWRYNLMANRVLLLLAMASRCYPNVPMNILKEISGHFLKNLKSQLPQTRILAISALNTLLKESPHKYSGKNGIVGHEYHVGDKSSLEDALIVIFQEEGFFNETLNSLSHVHFIRDVDGASSKGNYDGSSLQNFMEKSITRFYFDFSASWPRTPSWISSIGYDNFYSHFARIFKRLIQECGMPVILSLRSSLEQFVAAKERTKQCVAAEAMAGVLHADVIDVSKEWDSWIGPQLNCVINAASVESIPEWAAGLRYAVTGKGNLGTRAPLLRHKVIDCLMKPLPQTVSTTVVAKRYTFLAAVFIEISPPRMPEIEKMVHYNLLDELLTNMTHSSGHVREAVGTALSVLCSNLQLYASFHNDHESGMSNTDSRCAKCWDLFLIRRASELVPKIQSASPSDMSEISSSSINHPQDEIKWMETLFYFIISSLKSGRSSVLLDVIVELLHPVIALQETSNKDLSNLAKAAFELLKWLVFGGSSLAKSLPIILSLSEDPNWRTRSTTLTYLRSFIYRHTFVLSEKDKQTIWQAVEKLLTDDQLEIREHAAAVLAGLMKVGDEDLVSNFRQRAYDNAALIYNKRKYRGKVSASQVAALHGSILALAACVLSVPYDMPRGLPEHVTLLARFVSGPSPLKSTVTKAIAEFRRTHADEWNVHKESFTEEQLEVLDNTSASSSYFA